MAFGNKKGLEQKLSEHRSARSLRGSDRMNRLSGRSLALLALAAAVAGMARRRRRWGLQAGRRSPPPARTCSRSRLGSAACTCS
jgi:hypothetical protein